MRKIVACLFFAIWCLLGFKLSVAESPTYDEPVHLKAGHQYAVGNFDFDPIEPPLLRRVVTSLGDFAPSTKELLSYRLVIVSLTGILLGLSLYLFTDTLLSLVLTAVFLLSNAPLLAHGHYFTTDAIGSLLAFISILYLVRKNNSPVLSGLLIGLTMSTKLASAAYILPFALYYFWSKSRRDQLIFFISCFMLVWFGYDFRFQQPFRQFPFAIPLGGFFRMVKENFLFALRGQPIYFLGEINDNGPFFKSILSFLFKNPLPTLLIASLSLRQKKQNIFGLIILSTLVISSLKSLQFGIRHLLPAVVALCFLAGSIDLAASKVKKIFVIVLLFFQFAALSAVWPHPISYQNELASLFPQPVFTDSDYDWGQGLNSLNLYLNQNQITNYQLAYFGSADPTLFLSNYHQFDPNQEIPTFISPTCYFNCGLALGSRYSLDKAIVIPGPFYYFP